MANPIIRPALLYVGNDKVAECTDGTYDVDGAMEMQIAEGGTGFSRGRVTAKLDFGTIIPVKGMRVRVFELVVGQKDVTISVFVDGKYHKCDGVMNSAGATWEHAKGTCKGKFNFIGAEPDITG